MCDPVTLGVGTSAMGATGIASFTAPLMASMGTLGTIISAGGTILSTYGAYQSSKAQQDTLNYQAALDRNNQIIADRKAEDTLKRGEAEARQNKARVAQFQAEQLVGLAGQGGDVTVGSNVDLLADTAELGAVDTATIRSNAERVAYNERIQAGNFGSQAIMSSTAAKNQSPLLAAGSEFLSGVGNVASRWYR